MPNSNISPTQRLTPQNQLKDYKILCDGNVELEIRSKTYGTVKTVFPEKVLEIVQLFCWGVKIDGKRLYVQAHFDLDGKRSSIYLHDIVLNYLIGEKPIGMSCNHILTEDTLNNKLDNLEYATDQQQARNRTKRKDSLKPFINVYQKDNVFVVNISVDATKKHCGRYKTITEAARRSIEVMKSINETEFKNSIKHNEDKLKELENN